MMKRIYAVLAVAFFATAAYGQSATVANHAVAVGKGVNVQGFTAVGPGATAGLPLLTGGTGFDPAYGILGYVGGGTNASTQIGARNNMFPTPTRAGDVVYWSGTAWVTLAGNNSGSNCFGENASGVPSWVTCSGGGGTPGGSSGQVQYNNAGAFGGFTVGGDATLNTATGALTLASTITAGGPSGSATVAPVITWDLKGRLTAVTTATITPAVASITGLGTSVATALAVNVGTSGSFVVNGGALGTPTSGVATNLTGTAAGLTAGTVTTNANLTGPVTSVGNATTIGANQVSRANEAQGVARSVIGVTGNATANVADIQGTANQVLVVNNAGTALAFGQVNLSSSAAVVNALAVANGGTNCTTASGTCLDNITGFASTGFLSRAGSGAYFARTITGSSPIVVTNGDGVSGNPAISFDNTAWTSYTVTATAQTPGGTPPTFTATGRYKQIGKTVFVQVDVTVTSAGTGSGGLRVSLPFTAAAFNYMGTSSEILINGKSGRAVALASSSVIDTRDATGATYIVTGAEVVVGLTYEVP